MRIALLPDGATANTVYRSVAPMVALAEAGHEVRELRLDRIDVWESILDWCELLHVHRVCDGGAVELARAAKARGVAVVWDDDDDVTRAPRGTRGHADVGGLRGAKRLTARARLFESVDLVTTPSPVLAQRFLDAGAPSVRVIENYVVADRLGARAAHQGLHVGWVAGAEHKLDLRCVPVVDALERLLAAHPHVRVTTIGVRLPLASDRYAHVPGVSFRDLLRHVADFDLGIAPLSPELAINHARSNVKLKEYAAAGVPWLASPIGPYAGLGEREGGRLVADDRWFEELDALVRDDRRRRRLAKRAQRWGRGQLLQRNLGRWEDAFAAARALAHSRQPAAAA